MSDAGAGREPAAAASMQQSMLDANQAAEQAKQVVDALDLLPPEKRGIIQRVLIAQESYSGPIPSPRILAGMEAVVPGSGRRVFDMAVKQKDFDHTFSNDVLRSESRYRICTLLVAFLILAGLIGGAVFCAIIHETVVATTLGSVAGLSVLAGVLLRGRDLFPAPVTVPTPDTHRPKPSQNKPKGPPTKRTQRGR